MNIQRSFRVLACVLTMATFVLPDRGARAAERRMPEDIRLDDLIADTQATFEGAPPSHMATALWIPYEHWQFELSGQDAIDPAMRRAVLDRLRGMSLLAVLQMEIGEFGDAQ